MGGWLLAVGTWSVAIVLLAGSWALASGALEAASHHHGALTLSQPSGKLPEDAPKPVVAFWKRVPEDYRIMERTPVIDTQQSLLNGRKQFLLHCASCHGTLGRGDGPRAPGMKPAPADFLNFSYSAYFPPGVKYWLIAKGDKGLGMPGQPKLVPRDIWDMVNYILALQAKVKSEGYDQAPHKGH